MDLFEQIGKRLTDVGQNVAQQTKNLADVTQLNSAISDKEKKISQLYLSVGQQYYEGYKEGRFSEYQDIVEEIDALYAEIAQNRERIKQIKGVVKCPKCGADVPLNAAFCNACGTKMERENDVSENSGAQRYCSVCHAVIGPEDSYCNRCGAKVES